MIHFFIWLQYSYRRGKFCWFYLIINMKKWYRNKCWIIRYKCILMIEKCIFLPRCEDVWMNPGLIFTEIILCCSRNIIFIKCYDIILENFSYFQIILIKLNIFYLWIWLAIVYELLILINFRCSHNSVDPFKWATIFSFASFSITFLTLLS